MIQAARRASLDFQKSELFQNSLSQIILNVELLLDEASRPIVGGNSLVLIQLSGTRGIRRMKYAVLIASVYLTTFSFAAAQDAQTWVGKWSNRKYRTSGPLKCVAQEPKAGDWNAVFTGTFQGDPFEFRASFQGKARRVGKVPI